MRHLCAFFLLGALLFGAKRWLAQGDEPRHLVVSVPRAASDADVQRAIDQALLGDLALAGPAVHADPVVRDQLLRAMESARADESDEALVQRALALGVQRVDPVVRERLAFQGEQMLRATLPLAEPSDADLERYLRAHEARYREPPRVSFTQVFVSRSLRGERTLVEAEALLSRLRGDPRSLEQAATLGDPTILPRRMELASAREVDARFGPGLAEHLWSAERDAWSGPYGSAYGMHLVYVHGLRAGHLPALSQVRARVRSDAMHDASKQALERALTRLRAAYRIEVRRGDA